MLFISVNRIEIPLSTQTPEVEVVPLNSQVIQNGGQVVLSCRVLAGNPHPTVTWMHDKQPISQSFENVSPGSILFLNITAPKGGDYECHASNRLGKMVAVASIQVQKVLTPKLPPLITITPNAPQVMVMEGDQLNLICSADGSPAPSVEWKRSDRVPVLSEYSSNSVALVRKSTVIVSDAGVYICHAKNEIGESQETIKVSVQSKPIQQHKIATGDGVKISCKLFNSNKTLSWRRQDGRPMPRSARLDGGDLVS